MSVFLSYAHEDETLRAELGKHLSVLERQGLISTWHDRMITAGDEWAGSIDQRLEEAKVILLLISADFVHSRYCFDVEMKRAIERHESKDALVIPIVLRPVLMAGLPFATLQALPRDARPATEWPSLDAALVDITEGLRSAIEGLSDSQRSSVPNA